MAKLTNEEKALRISRQTGLDYTNVLQGLQMADIEFQMAVAPYSGYEGPVDPSIARYHSLPEGAQSGLLGFSTPSEAANHYISAASFGAGGDEIMVPAEPGTVNVIGAKGATPATWAHEYSHQLEKDKSLYKKAKSSGSMDAYLAFTKFGSKNAQEVGQRILDIRSAQNMDDVSTAVNYIAKEEIKSLESQIDKAFSEDDVEEARRLLNKSNSITENIINNPTDQSITDYIKTSLSDVNTEYDKIGAFKSNLFKKIVSSKDDKEQKAKAAKTFKESLD